MRRALSRRIQSRPAPSARCRICLEPAVPCPGGICAQDRLEQASPFGEERVPTALSQENSCRGSRVSLSVPAMGAVWPSGPGRRSGQALRNVGTSEHRTGVKVPEPRGGCCRTLWLWTGAWPALGADPPREAELRGDLACRRLGSERKYVKRIYARDTGKAGRQFAR